MDRFEQLVDHTPGAIDPWCSGPDWIIAAHEAFGSGSEPVIVTRPAGMAALALYQPDDGTAVLAGMEPMWGFACPLVGPDPEAIAAATADRIAGLRWDQLVLPGFPEDLELARRVAPPFARFGPVLAGPGIARQVASIADLNVWWSRRSPRFRRNLRRAQRDAESVGMQFVTVCDRATGTDADALIDRLVDIERRTWKGTGSIDDDGLSEPTGIVAPDMQTFYRRMTERLIAKGRARIVVAMLDGEDVGYILGGVRNGRYRGLQLSYTTEVAQLSVGHLLQLQEIQNLASTRAAHTYDLGMDMEYKEAWADRVERSVTLVVRPES